ncbi:hypothetical protein [Allocoleopsis sp.]|uniref:hypothetical protein n=1 Tax=Allocoleopsis sp. TaxID=3088169 RepID=UPI002FD1876A
MNFSVFQSNPSSVSLESPLSVSSSVSAQKPIEEETTTIEPTKPSSKSLVNPVSNVYWLNALNSPISLMDEQENYNSEAIQTKTKIIVNKRLYWWM